MAEPARPRGALPVIDVSTGTGRWLGATGWDWRVSRHCGATSR